MFVHPNNVSVQKWKNHFENMHAGKVNSFHKSYIVRGSKNQLGYGSNNAVNIVSPTAQTIYRAKADVKRDDLDKKEIFLIENDKKGIKRKKHELKSESVSRPKKKVKKSQLTTATKKKKKRKSKQKDRFGLF